MQSLSPSVPPVQPRPGVYIASPRALVLEAQHWARVLEGNGVRVVSTWHRRYMFGESDPVGDAATEVLRLNVRELHEARVVVLLLSVFASPRETYIEVGRALERGVPVLWHLLDKMPDGAMSILPLSIAETAPLESLADATERLVALTKNAP